VTRIAISYRRDDSAAITGRIFDRLVARYGADTVFRDVDNIPLGIDFREHINSILAQTDITLVVVGKRWFGPLPRRRRRIDDPADPVRVEVETALRNGMPVVPLLVEGGAMPNVDQLPDSLREFVYRNGLEIDSGRDFDQHIERLIRSMEPILARRAKEPEEAAQLAEEEKRRAEATRQAEEEQRRTETARQAEEEQQRAEAARQAEEERRRAEAARLAEEEKRRADATRQAEEEKRRAEAARQAEEEKRRAEAARQAAEEKRRAEAARQAAEEKRDQATADLASMDWRRRLGAVTALAQQMREVNTIITKAARSALQSHLEHESDNFVRASIINTLAEDEARRAAEEKRRAEADWLATRATADLAAMDWRTRVGAVSALTRQMREADTLTARAARSTLQSHLEHEIDNFVRASIINTLAEDEARRAAEEKPRADADWLAKRARADLAAMDWRTRVGAVSALTGQMREADTLTARAARSTLRSHLQHESDNFVRASIIDALTEDEARRAAEKK
jgi:TIR domain